MKLLLNRFACGKTRALTMSYDDGTIYDRKLIDIFNRYDIRGSFFLNSGNLGFGKGDLTKNGYGQGKWIEPCVEAGEVKTLYAGHEVSGHSLTHPCLGFCSPDGIREEIIQDRKNLESLVEYPVRGISYPGGYYDNKVLGILPYLGIEYARTINCHGNFSIPDNFLVWNPTCHHNDGLMEKAESFLNPRREGGMSLFYIWGHSYEFERDNNWDYIEEFCKFIGNNEKVWYATNIEIADYIKALNNLCFGVEGRYIYNPSAVSVWISADSTAVEIKPGETVKM